MSSHTCIYCDVPGSPCLSKKQVKCTVRFFLRSFCPVSKYPRQRSVVVLHQQRLSQSGLQDRAPEYYIIHPKLDRSFLEFFDPVSCRFGGDPTSLALDNIYSWRTETNKNSEKIPKPLWVSGITSRYKFHTSQHANFAILILELPVCSIFRTSFRQKYALFYGSPERSKNQGLQNIL